MQPRHLKTIQIWFTDLLFCEQHDIDKMSKYFIADYIKTEGSSLPQTVIDEINFYKNQGREFIIITDPDFPGTQIRNKLLEIIPNSKQAFVRKENARTTKKVGVEHADQDELKKALENVISYSDFKVKIKQKDLVELGLTGQSNSALLREKIAKEFNFNSGNTKAFLKRINSVKMEEKELKEKLYEILSR